MEIIYILTNLKILNNLITMLEFMILQLQCERNELYIKWKRELAVMRCEQRIRYYYCNGKKTLRKICFGNSSTG